MPHSDEALDLDECRRPRSESSTGADDLNTHFSVSYLDRHYPQHKMVRHFFNLKKVFNSLLIIMMKLNKLVERVCNLLKLIEALEAL